MLIGSKTIGSFTKQLNLSLFFGALKNLFQPKVKIGESKISK